PRRPPPPAVRPRPAAARRKSAARTAPARPLTRTTTPAYLLHTVPGLEELLAEELRERVPAARVLRTVRGFDERTSLLVVALRGEPAPLLGLRLAEDAFAVGAGAEDVPGGWGGLRALAGAVGGCP